MTPPRDSNGMMGGSREPQTPANSANEAAILTLQRQLEDLENRVVYIWETLADMADMSPDHRADVRRKLVADCRAGQRESRIKGTIIVIVFTAIVTAAASWAFLPHAALLK